MHRPGAWPTTTTLPLACPSRARPQAADIKSGLDIFGLPAPAYQELASMEKSLDTLGRMWGTVEEWEGTYAGWKETKFRDIKVGVGCV